MNHLPAMTRSVTLALVVGALTGCINLDPKPDPTRYYVIDAETTADVKRAGECRRTILVGPVRVAGYADRPAIVERHGEHEIVQLGLHHWGEALSQALPRVITQRLAARLP